MCEFLSGNVMDISGKSCIINLTYLLSTVQYRVWPTSDNVLVLSYHRVIFYRAK